MPSYKDLSPIVRGIIILFLLGLLAATIAFSFSYFATAARTWRDTTGVRQISVTGEGKATVKPDIAMFTATVVTQAKKVGEAQSKNSTRSNQIMQFLKNGGIAEKDIKTIGYSINPQYTYFDSAPCLSGICPPRRPPEIYSYEVRHTIQVKVRDLQKVDDLLEGVVTNGVNEVGQISFSVDDEKAVEEEARKKAIEDARKKAKVMAKDLGVRLGRIISFSESGGGGPIPPYFYAAESRDSGGVAKASPEVAPGEQEVTLNMTITFEIR